jgi:adenylate cyclase
MPHDPSREAAPPGDATIDYLDERDPRADAYWHAILTGDMRLAPISRLGRAVFRHLPSEPRCKWCYAPYGAPFGPLLARIGYGRWAKNPSLCGKCLHYMEAYQGGAEVELAVMFADLRGSTEIAASMSAAEYRQLLNTYYGIAGAAVQGPGGIVDKYLGDGVLALFLVGYCDADPASTAVEAGLRILEGAAEHGGLPVGVGVHHGTAYVGIVGRAGQPTDFTALGDAVNVAERISSSTAAGEELVSDALAAQLPAPPAGAVHRELTLKGVAEPVAAWSLRTAPAEAEPGR